MNRIEVISEVIESIDSVYLKNELKETKAKSIVGEIDIEINDEKYSFEMEIQKPYPFQFHNQETIQFVNKQFLKYNHVNADGSICLHTNSHPGNFREKLILDLNGLKSWVQNYLIEEKQDHHYEHIIVPYNSHDDIIRQFLFTDINIEFEEDQFGLCGFSLLANTVLGGNKGETYIVKEFGEPLEAKCNWSMFYSNTKNDFGFYILTDPPVTKDNHRIAATRWDELTYLIHPEFLELVSNAIRNNRYFRDSKFITVFFGYKIPGNKVHWQVATFPKNNPPIYSVKTKDRNWTGKLNDSKINWTETIDCSYHLFFGRGKLSEHIVTKKILLIGCGATGSILAENLVRGGAKTLALVDYDTKEPGNISRSNYRFATGVTDKTDELGLNLMSISPFIEIIYSNILTDKIKILKYDDNRSREELQDLLNEYGYIFDCSTDNDLLYILDDLNLTSKVISIGITNHANEMVVTAGTNIYKKTAHIFNQLDQDINDLFNPTGCWSPTFKARNTDISVLVNTAINEIDRQISLGSDLRNFYISREENNIKICHY
ncbi:ThiF family adenylyltransferase [Marivirga salinae]|uniref:ThiF family adenylyltransferase n=1 Tax=Marivirga salinarum TaxID=3059078 RepID=A0AA51RBY5_9BACT|nr:ThiF family adenylyltransferase [Marivirga sp. BDSF4-3]WMN11028.1 ThiF family adenylyltransferase [Marivirga sp. BDSF4-3]